MDDLIKNITIICAYFICCQVTVENFIRVLTGRLPPSTPRSKRLLSDDRSNVLVYMTGTGVLFLLNVCFSPVVPYMYLFL